MSTKDYLGDVCILPEVYFELAIVEFAAVCILDGIGVCPFKEGRIDEGCFSGGVACLVEIVKA